MSTPYQYPNARILVFAKAPIPGEVKTRLIPGLGRHGTCQLYERLLQHSLDTVSASQLCPVDLWCSPDTRHPSFSSLQQSLGITLHEQQGNDLGERMSYALSVTLLNSDRVLLIGADCPQITADYLHQALNALENDNDVVIGPAEDGGYVLVGLKQSQPAIFDFVSWGTNIVLIQTREALKSQGLKWHELTTLRDVDEPADLTLLDPAFTYDLLSGSHVHLQKQA